MQGIYEDRVKNDRRNFKISAFLPFQQGNSRAEIFKLISHFLASEIDLGR